MSRIANIGIHYENDLTAARAGWEAFRKEVESKGITIPFNFSGAGGSQQNFTLGGGSAGSGQLPTAMTGASSLNLPMLLNRAVSQLMPQSSPAWGTYFGQIQQQLAAMSPTSSPNWGVLMQQSMMNAMYPPGASSPNWAYYATIAAGNRGGGTQAATPGFWQFNRRTAFAGLMAVGGLNHLATVFTHEQSIEEAMGRGDIDDALQSQLSDAQQRRQGAGGLLRAAYHWYSGDPNYDDAADEEAARQGIATRRFDRTSMSITARTRALGYRRESIGVGDVVRTAIEGRASIDALTEEQRPFRDQVSSLRNLSMNDQANQLEKSLNSQLDAAKKLADAQNKEAERLRDVSVRGLDRGTFAGSLAASGFTVLAERQSIIDKRRGEIDRLGDKGDPVLRAALQRRMSADVSAFDIGTSREVGFQVEDAEAQVGISRLRGQRDIFGAERAGVEMRRRAAMRVLPQNWLTDLLGAGRLRGALNDQFNAEIGEIGSRESFANGMAANSYRTTIATNFMRAGGNGFGASMAVAGGQAFAGIAQALPGQSLAAAGAGFSGLYAQFMEGMSAMAMMGSHFAGGAAANAQLLARNPLGAQITQLETARSAALYPFRNVPFAGVLTNAINGYFDSQTDVLRMERQDLIDRADLRLGGERQQLQSLLRHDRVGATVAGIVTSGLDEARQFHDQGMFQEQRDALRNTLLQLQLTKQQFAESYHGVEIGQNFETSSPRATASTDQILKDIQASMDKVVTAINKAASAK